MFLVSLMKNKVSDSLNRSYWLLKISLLILITIYSFKVSQRFFKVYFWICILFSPLTILWMGICIIDLLYKLAEFLGEKYFEQGNRTVGVLMVIISILGVLGTVHTTRRAFYIGCSDLNSLISFCMALCIIVVLTLLKLNPKANLLTTSLFTFVLSNIYLMSEGSRDESSCSSTDRALLSKKYQILFYIGLSLSGTLFISLISKSNEDYNESGSPARTWEAAPTSDGSLPDARATDRETSEDQSLAIFRTQTAIYHVYLIFAACLATVLVTSWKFDNQSGFSGLVSPKSEIGHAVQQTTLYLSVIVYIWALVAPKLFPDREF